MTTNASDQFRGKYNLGITDFIKGISFPEDFLLLSTEALSKYPGKGMFSESWLFEYLNNISERFIDAIDNDRIDWMTGHLRSFTDQKVDSFLEANAKKPLSDADKFKDECFLYIVYRIKTEVERNKKRGIDSFSPKNDVKFYTDRYHLLFRDFLSQTPVGAKDYVSYLDNISVTLASSLKGKDKLKDFTDHLDLLASIIVKTATEYTNDVLTIKLKLTMSELIDSYLNARNINPENLPEKFYDNCFLIIVYRIQLWEKEGKANLISKPANKAGSETIVEEVKPTKEEPVKKNLNIPAKEVKSEILPLFDKDTYNTEVSEFIRNASPFDKKNIEEETKLIVSYSKKSNISEAKLISYLDALSEALGNEIDKNGKEWKVIHVRRLIEHKIGVFLKDTPLTETRESRKLYDACFLYVLDKLKKHEDGKTGGDDSVVNSGEQTYGFYIDDMSEVSLTEINNLESEISANERIYNKNFNSEHYMMFIKSLLPILQQAVDNPSYKVSDIVKHIDDSIEFYRKQGKNQCSGFSTMVFRYLSMLIKLEKQKEKNKNLFPDKSTAQDKKKSAADNIPFVLPGTSGNKPAEDVVEIRSRTIQPEMPIEKEEVVERQWADKPDEPEAKENKKARKLSIFLYTIICILFLALILIIISLMPNRGEKIDNPDRQGNEQIADRRFNELNSSEDNIPGKKGDPLSEQDTGRMANAASSNNNERGVRNDENNSKAIEQTLRIIEEAGNIGGTGSGVSGDQSRKGDGDRGGRSTDSHNAVDVANLNIPDATRRGTSGRGSTNRRSGRNTELDQSDSYSEREYVYPYMPEDVEPNYDESQSNYTVVVGGRPASGSVVYKTPKYAGVYDNTTKGYINIANDTSNDVVVIIYYITGGKVMRNIYIRAGESSTVRGIPEGLYRMKCASGKEWNPNFDNGAGKPIGGFTTSASFQDMDKNEKFGMHEQSTYEGSVNFPTFNVRLGSGIFTKNITAEDFFKN